MWTEPRLKQDLSENLCIITLDMYIFVGPQRDQRDRQRQLASADQEVN